MADSADPFDDMEPTLVDEYMQESREARAKGNHAKADELYGKATAIHRAESGVDADHGQGDEGALD